LACVAVAFLLGLGFGHVKETPEQEAMEEGAVGGVMAEKSEAEKHTTIGKNIPSIDLTQMKKAIAPAESGLIHLANQGARYLAP
jgi:hypothetical protein